MNCAVKSGPTAQHCLTVSHVAGSCKGVASLGMPALSVKCHCRSRADTPRHPSGMTGLQHPPDDCTPGITRCHAQHREAGEDAQVAEDHLRAFKHTRGQPHGCSDGSGGKHHAWPCMAMCTCETESLGQSLSHPEPPPVLGAILNCCITIYTNYPRKIRIFL